MTTGEPQTLLATSYLLRPSRTPVRLFRRRQRLLKQRAESVDCPNQCTVLGHIEDSLCGAPRRIGNHRPPCVHDADCGTPIDSASDELAYFLCSNARRSRVPEASLKLTGGKAGRAQEGERYEQQFLLDRDHSSKDEAARKHHLRGLRCSVDAELRNAGR